MSEVLANVVLAVAQLRKDESNMATMTAQILIGDSHPNHGGINPTHYLFLSENSRAAWVLIPQNIFKEEQSDIGKITWIPTVENMLEDALMMIAIHISKNREIIELAKSFCGKIETDWLELYSDLTEPQRKQIYKKCREVSFFSKLIVSAFKGSTIENQLLVLEQYKMDVEICSPIYSRIYSSWTNQTIIEGSLL